VQVHIERNGQQFGPYTLDEVNSHLSSGAILPTDNAWAQGQPGWVPISQFPGITLTGAAPPPSAPPPVSPIQSEASTPGRGKNKVVLAGIIVGAVALLALIVLAVLMATGKLDSDEEIKGDLKQYVNSWENIIIPYMDTDSQLLEEISEVDSKTKMLQIYEDMLQNTQACDKRLADLNPKTVVVRKLHREVIEIRKISLSMSTKLYHLMKNGGELSRNEEMELERTMKEVFGRLEAWFKELKKISSKYGVPLDKEKWDSLDVEL
jgi:hypothetical protein